MWALLVLSLLAQDAGPAVTVSGSLDLHYVYRDARLMESRSDINGPAVAAGSAGFFSGPVRIRLDAEWGPDVRAVLEMGNRPINTGANSFWGDNPESQNVEILQAYVHLEDLPLENWIVRFGSQPLRFTNRYDEEAFLLDLSQAESSWGGFSADRDTLEPVGLRVWYDAAFFFKVQAFVMTVLEAGRSSSDEVVSGLYASAKISDRTTIKLIQTLFSGPQKHSSVWTSGIGLVHMPTQDWLVAGEGYLQYGASKSASAFRLSGRYLQDQWWVELGYEHASGDDATDPEDEAWQSYENVNRFAIVQSAEFGLDWDSNYSLLCVAAQYWFCETLWVRANVGSFTVPEAVSGVLTASEDTLGTEVDLELHKDLNENAFFFAKGAFLFDSEILEATTPARDDDTRLAVLGIQLNF